MNCKIPLAAAILFHVMGCSPATSGPLYTTKTGSVAVDQFVIWVQQGNETEIAKTARFETISGLFPQFKTSAEYLTWVDGCRIHRVAQSGSDSAGNTVTIDPSLETGPAAINIMEPIFWIYWQCPKGKYRQALNAEFEAPKIMVSEMMEWNLDSPVMRPPVDDPRR